MSSQDKFQHYVSQVDRELSKFPILNQVEKQTQVPKAYAALGVVALLSIFIFFNVAAGLLTTAIGWALPAFFSLRALETPGSNDDKQWLTYWVVFGFLTTLESVVNAAYWFPFYYTVKSLFSLWLLLPQTRGAETIYNSFLRPHFANKTQAPSTVPDAVHAHSQ